MPDFKYELGVIIDTIDRRLEDIDEVRERPGEEANEELAATLTGLRERAVQLAELPDDVLADLVERGQELVRDAGIMVEANARWGSAPADLFDADDDDE